MKTTFIVLRAIATELAGRIYVPVVVIAAIIAVVAITLTIWLITISAWWWLLAIPVYAGIILGSAVLTVIGFTIRLAKPRQTSSQKTEVKQFVDKLQNLSEVTQTPKFVLLFRVMRDIASRREDGFVKTTIDHTMSIRKDFDSLKRSFDQPSL